MRICESYHIENNNLFYLNSDYELIPDYILKECERIINDYKRKHKN